VQGGLELVIKAYFQRERFIRDMETLQRKFKKLPTKVARKAISGVMRTEAKSMKSLIQQEAPLGETGQLEGDFRVRAFRGKGRGRDWFGIAIIHGSRTSYETFVELGSQRNEQARYIRDVVDRERWAALNRIVDGLKKAVEEAAKNG
jgi:hypothetical protein